MNPEKTCSCCAAWKRIGAGLGECRRNPPVMSGEAERGAWPTTLPDEGCLGFRKMYAPKESAHRGRAIGVEPAVLAALKQAIATPEPFSSAFRLTCEITPVG